MDFISRSLQSDIALRLTAREALNHPWIRAGEDVIFGINDTELSGLQFANFTASHKFKVGIAELFKMKYQDLKAKSFNNLRQLFITSNANENGEISLDKFREGLLECDILKLNEAEFYKIFKDVDISKIGNIDFKHLLDELIHDYMVVTDMRLYEAFRDLDDNENGRIKTEKLKAKIVEMDPYGNSNEILQIIEDSDLDVDGYIDYQDYLRKLHPDFNEISTWF